MVRIRDYSICYMCEEAADERRLMHAHHIRPKAEFPELAYNLDNGVCLCARCHIEVVHTSVSCPKKMYALFHRYVGYSKVTAFNDAYQARLTPEV